MPIKTSITQDQVLSDLKNVIVFLTTVDKIMPNVFEEAAIDALTAIANSPALLSLLVTAMQKV